MRKVFRKLGKPPQIFSGLPGNQKVWKKCGAGFPASRKVSEHFFQPFQKPGDLEIIFARLSSFRRTFRKFFPGILVPGKVSANLFQLFQLPDFLEKIFSKFSGNRNDFPVPAASITYKENSKVAQKQRALPVASVIPPENVAKIGQNS